MNFDLRITFSLSDISLLKRFPQTHLSYCHDWRDLQGLYLPLRLFYVDGTSRSGTTKSIFLQLQLQYWDVKSFFEFCTFRVIKMYLSKHRGTKLLVVYVRVYLGKRSIEIKVISKNGASTMLSSSPPTGNIYYEN